MSNHFVNRELLTNFMCSNFTLHIKYYVLFLETRELAAN